MLNKWDEVMLPQHGLCFCFFSGDISIGCFAIAVGCGFYYYVYGSGTLDAVFNHNLKSRVLMQKILSLILYLILRALLAIMFVTFINMVTFQVARTMLREEGMKSFYKGLGPSLLGIAPYIALNFCVFDL